MAGLPWGIVGSRESISEGQVVRISVQHKRAGAQIRVLPIERTVSSVIS
jgi:hypothetical protein